MYVNPFVMGILATLTCECACAFIYALMHRHDYENEYDSNRIFIENTNSEEMNELINLLERMSKKDEQNNNNQSE